MSQSDIKQVKIHDDATELSHTSHVMAHYTWWMFLRIRDPSSIMLLICIVLYAIRKRQLKLRYVYVRRLEQFKFLCPKRKHTYTLGLIGTTRTDWNRECSDWSSL